MRSLKDQCVIKLRVRRKTKGLPSLGKQLDDVGCTDREARPAGDKSAMDGDAGENGKLGSSSQNQTFNGIERVEFASSGGNLREVPADWRRWSPGTPSRIQNTPALQDATDGSPRRDWSTPPSDHYRADRIRSGVSEITVGKVATQPQNLVFSGRARSIDRPWRARRPIRAQSR